MIRALVLIALMQVAVLVEGLAYPPAPGVTVKGLVRDEYGWVLRAEGAEVVFRQGDVIIARAPIANEVSFGFNYRLQLPTDSGTTADPYRPGALLAGSGWSAEVHAGGAVYLPIEILTGNLPELESATEIQLDLTLGADLDGDGLPDDWELWQLQVAGIFPGDPNYNLDQLGVPGDYDLDGIPDFQEFLAGSFAVFSSSLLRLEPVGFWDASLVEFDYYAVRDKAYELEGSDDLDTWIPIPSNLDSPFGGTVNAWTSNRTGWLKLYAPPQGARRFYRLRVR